MPCKANNSLWDARGREQRRARTPATKDLAIGFVPYSPLGRGFLTGKIKDSSQLTKRISASRAAL
jgi:aryl-alcohol dehydrogenase-like predicted oxidoreductase